ncbi:DUF3397 domain-containing protein [Rossellomorea vietnamensis]|uniref:DUF3397 domain-containing protein n=1 Tax=Rossellomorea vietnamensis TaxID=218284 RepID=A0A5D4MAK1_9BACI|nr:DUF3397 domain-containing protein [Rossellomorea vietnamensis]TYR98457.1 DUF3397 domain-containing protein [Rossellomorea vietnamensis]
MSTIFSSLVAVFTLVPFLGYFASFIAMKQLTGSHRRALNTAVNVTTFFLIFSVHFIIQAIWDKSLLWVLILVLLISTGILSVIHWKVKEEIVFLHVIKGGWRLNFLLFSTAYILLLFYGVASRIMQTF